MSDKEKDTKASDERGPGSNGTPLEEIDMEDADEEADKYFLDYPEELVDRIRAKLTIPVTVPLSLNKINTGWEKKMRFSILYPCPKCGVANHVDVVGLPPPPTLCEECLNKKCFERKELIKIPIPIGVKHGSTTVLTGRGHVFSDYIQGNVVVLYLDQPHEHYLRIFDDVVVCFQIDYMESKSGVTRLINPPGYPEDLSVVLQTAPGCEIKDNDMFIVKGLGLRKEANTSSTGDLYVLFFVRRMYSVNPVKLKNVRVHSCSKNGEGPNFTSLSSMNGSDDSSHGKQNGICSPTKKRKNGDTLETGSPKKSKLTATLPVPEEIPRERLATCDPVDDRKLSFLDRLVNHPGTVPLPFRDPVPDEIPFAELRSLWKRRDYDSWWRRVESGGSYPDCEPIDTNALDKSRKSAYTSPDCQLCSSGKTPLFNLTDDSVHCYSEAIQDFLTRTSVRNPQNPKFVLKSKLQRCKVLRLLRRLNEYLRDPNAQGVL